VPTAEELAGYEDETEEQKPGHQGILKKDDDEKEDEEEN